MHGIDVACFGECVDERHKNDDGRHRLNKVAHHCEQQDHHQHNQDGVIAGDAGDPLCNGDGPSQIGQHPTKNVGCADGDER